MPSQPRKVQPSGTRYVVDIVPGSLLVLGAQHQVVEGVRTATADVASPFISHRPPG